MYPGIILLIFLGIIIYMGIGQRVLDRLYLSDNQALFFIALIIVGSFFDIKVSQDPYISLNLGGAVIPFFLAVYVFSKADSAKEKIRTIIAIFLTAAVIFFVSRFFRNFGEGRDIIDPLYIYAITAGITAYILGRSRRSAFVAGILGYILYDLSILWLVLNGNIVTQIRIGGAGAFDTIVISGLLAVLLAELIGESRERITIGRGDDNNEK